MKRTQTVCKRLKATKEVKSSTLIIKHITHHTDAKQADYTDAKGADHSTKDRLVINWL